MRNRLVRIPTTLTLFRLATIASLLLPILLAACGPGSNGGGGGGGSGY